MPVEVYLHRSSLAAAIPDGLGPLPSHGSLCWNQGGGWLGYGIRWGSCGLEGQAMGGSCRAGPRLLGTVEVVDFSLLP